MTPAMLEMARQGWFTEAGAYVLVDGQFGSTGKGLLAGFMAEVGKGAISHVTTNAGPNSGHTAFMKDYTDGYIRVMTQQIPVAAVFLHHMGYAPIIYLNGGAIIDREILITELTQYFGIASDASLFIHPCAAFIHEENRRKDQTAVDIIASTGKGTGPALASKVLRHNMNAVWGPKGEVINWDWSKDVVFVETAQGFSLGINEARFYPHTTSRECTVMQAIADARIPHNKVKKVVMCVRTFPIRVGNTAIGYSGKYYEDQRELTWEEVGVEPELTTVTKRVRRVFTWSRNQFREAVAANQPDTIFLNFCNYMKSKEELDTLVRKMSDDYHAVMNEAPDSFLLGFGPYSGDIYDVFDGAWHARLPPS